MHCWTKCVCVCVCAWARVHTQCNIYCSHPICDRSGLFDISCVAVWHTRLCTPLLDYINSQLIMHKVSCSHHDIISHIDARCSRKSLYFNAHKMPSNVSTMPTLGIHSCNMWTHYINSMICWTEAWETVSSNSTFKLITRLRLESDSVNVNPFYQVQAGVKEPEMTKRDW